MKFIFLIFFIGTYCSIQSQSIKYFERSFSENTSDLEKFSLYNDSLEWHIYRDISIAEFASNECQKLIDKKTILPDSLLFHYAINKIYLEHSHSKALEAYKLVLAVDRDFKNTVVNPKLRATFNYIRSFTFMSIGDLEEAQKSYYENINLAEASKDTDMLMSNLFSLGQLYSDELDYNAAINCYETIFNLDTENRNSATHVLANYELGVIYADLKQYDKALATMEKGYKAAKENKYSSLEIDILISKGEVFLSVNKIDSALVVYNQLLDINQKSKDQTALYSLEVFKAELFRKQKLFIKALVSYEKLIDNKEDLNETDLLETLESAQELSQEMGNYKLAHEYLLDYTKLKQKRDLDDSKQKTNFLKIKYESEKKERENKTLSDKVLQNKTERQLMYLWLTILFVVLSALAYGFHANKRYSKRLEEEVLERTSKLEVSNKLLDNSNSELKEFNRILAHDLKEPLRNIIGFSQLASSKNKNNEEVEKYLQYVLAGGKQLDNLVNGIKIFLNEKPIDIEDIKLFKVNALLKDKLVYLEGSYPSKTFKLNFLGYENIQANQFIVSSIFDILLENAARFNDNEVVNIDVIYYKQNDLHNFEIKDNGIGIPKEYQKHVFAMFKRLHDRKTYEGAGLGLSLAEKLIKRIHGSIIVKSSEVNEGTTILFNFPYNQKEQASN